MSRGITQRLDALGAAALRRVRDGLRGRDERGGGDDGAWLATRELEVEGRPVRVSHRAAGDGASTVLFLPGYPDTLQVFARAAGALDARAGYIALDFPGQGRSAASDGARPTFAPEARARWLAALLDRLGVARVRVYAHDMGAHAALELALGYPARVEAVVLSHALLDGAGPTSTAINVLRRARAYRALLPAAPQVVVARSVATFLPREAPLTPRVEADVAGAFTEDAARTTVAVCDAAEAWLARGLAPFAEVSAPVALLWGSEEAHFPRAHADALARVVKRARWSEVAGGHHWIAWHAPERVAREVVGAG